MTQKNLIEEYLEEFGSILPAKMAGKIYCGMMFGSETSKRCREMRADKMLKSEGEGKFERFYLNTASQNQPRAEQKPSHDIMYSQKQYCCGNIMKGLKGHSKDCIVADVDNKRMK